MPIYRAACPACGSEALTPVFAAEDYTVSHERFDIVHCEACTLRFTQGVPEPEHIGRYYASEEYVSHSNTSRGFVNGLYQRVRDVTLAQKRALLREVTGKPTGSLLDVGCGTGEFLHTMQQAAWTTRGLEPDAGARAFAKTTYGLDVTEPDDLFALDGPYDAVTLWHVLEHVHRLHDYLDRLRRLIGHAGTLVIAVPNYTSPDAAHYGAAWAAYDVPRHLYHFSPQAMRRLLDQHDLAVRETRAMPFDAFYVSLLSERYAHGGLRPVRAFAQGAKSWWPARTTPTTASSVMYICGAA